LNTDKYIHEIGSLWVDGLDRYYLIVDVVDYKYISGRVEFIIQLIDTGDKYENEVKDFYQYHTRVS